MSQSSDLPMGTSARTVADPMFAARALAVAAREIGTTPDELLKHRKKPPEVLRGRWAVMQALARRELGVSAIARRMKRDHSTVNHGLWRARTLLATDPEFAELFAKVDAA